MKVINLKPGEVICNECNGTGLKTNQVYHPCPKCYGTGKLDWIENIVGRNMDYEIWYPLAGFPVRRTYGI